jgi:exopolyphosphatase / guanosine-5'-triphosphate,3'-diphosphate pyrophosphatase
MDSYRLAAIDVGSNAARLLITDVTWQNHLLRSTKVAFYRLPIQLGSDVFSHGFLSEEKIDNLKHALTAFQSLIQIFRPDACLACGTAALREAENTVSVMTMIKDYVTLPLHIIDGNMESELIGLATAAFAPADQLAVTIDVGGGSTEISIKRPDGQVEGHSFPIGTLRMLQHFVDDQAWYQLKSLITEKVGKRPTVLIGTGGNINKIPTLLGRKSPVTVTKKQINTVIGVLDSLSIPERCRRYGLKPDRAEVLLPALRIYADIMKWSHTSQLLIPKTGLSDALVILLAKELSGGLLPWEKTLLDKIRGVI